MRFKREYLYTIICAAIIVLGFGVGYLSGSLRKRNNISPEQLTPDQQRSIQTQTPTPSPDYADASVDTAEPFYYLLISEENALNFYEINADTKVLIKKINFQAESLHSDDSLKLTKGIKLSSKEEGYALIEDFTS